jgi:hypothetical protein
LECPSNRQHLNSWLFGPEDKDSEQRLQSSPLLERLLAVLVNPLSFQIGGPEPG